MAKQKFYVVWVGRKPDICDMARKCQEQINKFDDAKYKSYETKAAAEEAYRAGWKKQWGQGGGGKPLQKSLRTREWNNK